MFIVKALGSPNREMFTYADAETYAMSLDLPAEVWSEEGLLILSVKGGLDMINPFSGQSPVVEPPPPVVEPPPPVVEPEPLAPPPLPPVTDQPMEEVPLPPVVETPPVEPAVDPVVVAVEENLQVVAGETDHIEVSPEGHAYNLKDVLEDALDNDPGTVPDASVKVTTKNKWLW